MSHRSYTKRFSALAAALITSQQLHAQIPAPLAYWTFDETDGGVAADTATGGAAADATWGTADFAGLSWEPQGGQIGGAAVLSGSGTPGHFFDVTLTKLDGVDSYTIGGWFRPNAAQVGDAYKGLFMTRSANGVTDRTANFGIAWRNTNTPTPYVESRVIGDLIGTADTAAAIADGELWFHVVFTYDANGDNVLYLNGERVGDRRLSNGSFTTGGVWSFGRDPANNARQYSGALDDWGIWNEALTDETVQQIYNIGIQGFPLTGEGAEDRDGDGIPNQAEIDGTSNIFAADGSIITDGSPGEPTNPDLADSDGDGIDDLVEINNRLNPNDSTGDNGADGDPDGDNIGNLAELTGSTNPYDAGGELVIESGEEPASTDPQDADSDDDGVNDGDEVTGALNSFDDNFTMVGPGNGGAPTNPNVADTDGDTVNDSDEINGTLNPFLNGVLGDGAPDAAGDPTNPRTDDTDEDDLLDAVEINFSLNPNDPNGDNGPDGDPDMDNLINFDELEFGSDPLDNDSDDDTIFDGEEFEDGTNPALVDSDFDGLSDGEEKRGVFIDSVTGEETPTGFPATDGTVADSDEDGFGDLIELRAAIPTNPQSPAETPIVTPSAYWPLDETEGSTTREWIDNDNGVAPGTPGWDVGQIGNAVIMAGGLQNNQFFEVPTMSKLQGATSLTISFWMRPSAANGGYRGLFGTRSEGPTNNQNWGANIEGALNNNLDLRTTSGGTASQGLDAGSLPEPEGGGFASDVWYHVVHTYDGVSGDSRAYVDGVETAISNNGAPQTLFGEGWFIGLEPSDPTNRDFDGALDDLAVFPNALSAAEVLDIYTRGSVADVAARESIADIYNLSGPVPPPPSEGGLVIGEVSYDNGGTNTLSVTFNSTEGTTYQLYTTTDLAATFPENWTVVDGADIPGAAGAMETTYQTTAAFTDPKVFFRIAEKEEVPAAQ